MEKRIILSQIFIIILMGILITVLGINLKDCQETEIRLKTVTTELCEEHMIEQLKDCRHSYQPIFLGDSVYIVNVGLVELNLEKSK